MNEALQALEQRLDRVGLALMSPWTRVVLELTLGVAVVGASALLSPDGDEVTLFGVPIPVMCGYRARTGLPCPMCGATRAFVHLARGHALTAWSYNPAASVLFVGIVGAAALAAVRVVRRDPTWRRPHPGVVALGFGAWLALLNGSWLLFR